MPITTIKLQKETKERLDKLRENRSETYDDILRKILYVLNTTRDDPFKAKRVLERISEIRERMKDEALLEEEERVRIRNEEKQLAHKKRAIRKKK